MRELMVLSRDTSDSRYFNYQAVSFIPSQRNAMAREDAAYLDLEAFYKTTPPPFGHGLRNFFGFDSSYTNMNNGSYGALPTPVRKFCDDLTTDIEANPDKFYRLYAPEQMRGARVCVAKMIGAEPAECVFVTNASMGITTILRNFEWHEEDTIIKTSITYGAVAQLIKYLCDTPPRPTISTFEFHFPISRDDIARNFRAHVQRLVSERSERNRHGKIVAVIDTIASNPGVSLPWKQMVSICKDAGIWTVVDAAHSIGQELDIDLSVAQPDFWVSNCHKWLFAKRGCTVLYVPTRNQHIIKSPIPTPGVYKSPLDTGFSGRRRFVELFEWTSTVDWVPWLSVVAALDFREWLGGERRINEYTHRLAMAGGARLAILLKTSVMDPEGEHTLSMVNVALPIPGEIKLTAVLKSFFQHTILLQWDTYAAPFYHNGKWWARCSAQIWNELEDFDLMAEALKGVSAALIAYAGKRNAAVAPGDIPLQA
ncbi:pyridoxal phosphate-dependent transferase [Butyriboletus roseoflavus]|nr:pyridoxal phosphate-dependent transferase [Butyriboletus roseoflavus]